jgi:large subunit ribosomal protein L7/L12
MSTDTYVLANVIESLRFDLQHPLVTVRAKDLQRVVDELERYQKIEYAIRDTDELKEQLALAQYDVNRLTAENAGLQDDKDFMTGEVASATLAYERLHEKYEQLRTDYGLAIEDGGSVLDDLRAAQQEIASLQEQLTVANRKVIDLEMRVKMVENARDTVQYSFHGLQDKYADLVEKHDDQVQENLALQRTFKELQDRYDRLVETYDTVGGNFEDLQERYDNLKACYESLADANEALIAENGDPNPQFVQERDEIQAKYDQLKRQYDSLEEDRRYLITANEQLMPEYFGFKAENRTLKDQLDRYERALNGEPGEYGVKLLSFGNNKIQVIKALRDLFPQLGLKEAKELAESAPVMVAEKLNYDRASNIGYALQTAGADVQVKLAGCECVMCE